MYTVSHKLALALCAALILVPAAARALDVPGLGLDREDLEDLYVGRYGLGAPAIVKGAPNGWETGSVRGAVKGGQLPRTDFSLYNAFPAGSTASYDTSSHASSVIVTLAPAFAAGVIGRVDSASKHSGRFVQAIIYEPDRVKRSTQAGGRTRIQIAQRSHLAFRFGQFQGTGFRPGRIAGGLLARGCKAAVDLRRDSRKEPDTRIRMKVRCRGGEAKTQRVKDEVNAILGRNGNGFDVSASF
jgi:hypothetical protein